MGEIELDIDGDLVRKLSALLEELGLTEIEFSVGDQRLRVSRAATPAAVPVPAAVAALGEAEAAAAEAAHPGAVKAPMVGTVYLAAEPGSDPFVRVGDIVSEGQTLLLIEAMKTYNPVRAPVAGKVVRILVADATPVEFGEVLVIVE